MAPPQASLCTNREEVENSLKPNIELRLQNKENFGSFDEETKKKRKYAKTNCKNLKTIMCTSFNAWPTDRQKKTYRLDAHMQ